MTRGLIDACFVVLKVFSAWFLIVALFALLPRRRLPEAQTRLRFAVLIPARNEERCIAGIVESLRAQRYPAELFDIYVVPNNCTDRTAEAALRAGARVLSVSGSVRSKGAALGEALDHLLRCPAHYDAFCVFDADNESSETFLEAMNRTLAAGNLAAKSRILAKNTAQGAVCACYETYFCFANRFVNRARERLGLSARLIGTGFAVRRELLEKLGGFRTETLTEDAEFYAVCAAQGVRIAYCEDAVTYDEEPVSFALSMRQRLRWMSGILTVTRKKLPALLRGLTRRKSAALCFDAAMQLTFGYVQAILPFLLLAKLLLSPGAFVSSLPYSLAGWYLGGAASALAALLLERRLSRDALPGLLLYPLFLASFLPLETVSLFFRPRTWSVIPHTGVRLSESRRAA